MLAVKSMVTGHIHTQRPLRGPCKPASWHGKWVPFPAYSPELNPVENLWHYLRSHYWANRIYENYDDLRFAAIDA